MNKRIMTPALMEAFERFLVDDEKSRATIEKYRRDLQRFMDFVGLQPLDKSLLLAYKTFLQQHYALTSANSMLAALGTFLRFVGWRDLGVKPFKVAKEIFCPQEKELTRAEYVRLVQTAKANGNEQLSLILQTICATGIRVSELSYITVEAIHRGEATVFCKGRYRTVFLVRELRQKLLRYAQKRKLKSGAVFLTRRGKPLDRTTVWRAMKALCEKAGVASKKVFPHNLRHLFARTFYELERDIVKLADILGHSSVNTTRIYTVTSGERHRQKMERMHLIL